MQLEKIKSQLVKKAEIFITGGKRPTNTLLESWIGSVKWKNKEDEIPVDNFGNTMVPLATIFLKNLQYCPKELNGIELITIFMSRDVFEHLESKDLSQWFEIRIYNSLDRLIPCNYYSDMLKSFPLTAKLVDNDYPEWDTGAIPYELEEQICELEDNGDLEYYDDIFEENYAVHKLGGYPSFCQSGYWFEDGYEYVMQIVSDQKADFNIVDNGGFYFYYNQKNKDWKVYCDFY